MNVSTCLRKGSIVQIIRNCKWKNLYGIVDYIFPEVNLAYIFCVQEPNYHYEIRNDNLKDIIVNEY